MNDRRPLIAIALIMVIAFIPGLLREPPPVIPVDSTAVLSPIDSVNAPAAFQSQADSTQPATQGQPTLADSAPLAQLVPEDTVLVRSALYEYRISTVGGRIIGSRFLNYESMFAGDSTAGGVRGPLDLIPDGASMLDTRIAMGRDTVRFDAAVFTPNARELDVTGGPATLVLTGSVRGQPAELRYTFQPDDYRIGIAGTIGGVPSTGATLLVGLGDGFRNTEKKPAENHRESGVVTEQDGTTLTRYSSLDPQQTKIMTGPFDWVAVKSKYFVGGYFAVDSGAARISAVTVRADDLEPSKPDHAVTRVTMPLAANGTWNSMLYLGPMEYDRMSAIGYDFDDVNPYGWKGFRTVIRPFAVAIRGAFVWMHTALGLHYGFAIIFFGVFIRLLLWPLNHKAMRSMTEMQAIQPEMQELQAKYKEKPEKLQAEMLKLYREHKVNPLSGCWPMLLPYPFLVAVFFVLQSTIELRGVSFLWMPDLSQPDPLYIIPVFMVLSMFALSKLGQMGIPPNPQAKMMMYVMPAVFGFLFLNFASGLNLYYAVQNIAAAPQQFLISKQRVRILAEKQKQREK